MPLLRRFAALLLIVPFLVVSRASALYAALSLSTDHRPVAFGRMQLGEEKTLADFGGFHNEITCISTNGRGWFLKVNVLQPLVSGANAIPVERFQWHLVSTTGHGNIPFYAQFVPFSLFPESVYLSAPDETSGVPVAFRFKYQLQVPEEQASGIYQTTVRFTLTEIL